MVNVSRGITAAVSAETYYRIVAVKIRFARKSRRIARSISVCHSAGVNEVRGVFNYACGGNLTAQYGATADISCFNVGESRNAARARVRSGYIACRQHFARNVAIGNSATRNSDNADNAARIGAYVFG